MVNWDLIPTAAIQSVAVVTNNPAFGLNALGGAINVQMKNGFTYHGAEIDTMGGSFGRIQSSGQWGKQYDNFAVYGALEGLHDDGFRNFSASNVRRFYGDVGYKNDTSEFHLNMGAADNNFGAATTVPVELLQRYYGATYTTPQTTIHRVGYVNLTGKVEATPAWTVEGSAHVRVFDQKTLDANPTGTQPCAADPTLLCFGNGVAPANGLNGAQLANPFDPSAVLGENDRTTTRSTTTGVSRVAELKDGDIAVFDITPEDAGLPIATLDQLKGGDAKENAAAIHDVLMGSPGPFRDIVLLNAAAALLAADKAGDLREGLEQARASLASGAARERMEGMIAASQG